MDSHDLGDGVQARGPGEAASVQRSRHQHQGQGWLRSLSTVRVSRALQKKPVLCHCWFMPVCFLGREHLPSLGSVLRQRGDRRAAPKRPLPPAGCQHPRRLPSTHRCSGESLRMCHVSFCLQGKGQTLTFWSKTNTLLFELQLKTKGLIQTSNLKKVVQKRLVVDDQKNVVSPGFS